MKSIKIIIATIILITATFYLSGCSLITSETKVAKKDISLAENLEEAVKVIKDVKIKLSANRDGDQIIVKIVLDNPSNKPITSVESWLSYNPDLLKGSRIEVVDSPFELTAPYENTFDSANGLVMLGRANAEPITTKTINVAEVVFDVAVNETAMIDLYNYQVDTSGNTSANMMLGGVPYNVLLIPDSPALIIQ